jgi:hypothetical protein
VSEGVRGCETASAGAVKQAATNIKIKLKSRQKRGESQRLIKEPIISVFPEFSFWDKTRAGQKSAGAAHQKDFIQKVLRSFLSP